MSSKGLGDMIEGDFAEMCGGKFQLMSMGGRVEGLVCADPGVSGNYKYCDSMNYSLSYYL